MGSEMCIRDRTRSGPLPFEAVMAQHQMQQQSSQMQQYHQQPMEWRQARFGLSRRDLIAQAARLLARDYRESSRGRFETTAPMF